MDAEYVRDLVRQGKVDFIAHSELRLAQRVFDPNLVIRAILGGVVIQEYPHNEPLPRMVFQSIESAYKPLEVVCDIDEEEERVIIVTVKFGRSRKTGHRR